MIVNIEDVLEAQNKRQEINSLDIKDIQWCLNGKPILISKDTLEEWRFTGLSNTDFVNFCIPEILK